MARVTIYLPDELADRAREAGLNISGAAQEALTHALGRFDTDQWLHRLERLERAEVSHQRVIAALDAARDEFGS